MPIQQRTFTTLSLSTSLSLLMAPPYANLVDGQHPLGQRPATTYAGGNRGGAPPDPISNSEVKPSSADGTARETVWKSRSLPAPLTEAASNTMRPRNVFETTYTHTARACRADWTRRVVTDAWPGVFGEPVSGRLRDVARWP